MLQAVNNYKRIRAQIREICLDVHRESNVLLLPVTKTRPVAAILELYDSGIRDFGENRVQELLKKKDELPSDIRWHFIGHLQTNKAKNIAPFIAFVHSVDSMDLAHELSKRAGDRTISILIELNISSEQQKQGVNPEAAEALVAKIATACPNLNLCGLMGMASFEEDLERTRPQFRSLREHRDKIQERHPELKAFKELSMGMSNDFEVAIEEGATIVRIGSALFESEQ